MGNKIYLSPPHLSGQEKKLICEALDSNWIAPVGPHLEAFEQEFCEVVGCNYAVAVSSGTAALHLALRGIRLKPGSEVFVSTLTFVASVNPILYERAVPVFIDSEKKSWNMDPNVLEDALRHKAKKNKLPNALILVHLYGQSADIEGIKQLCDAYEVPIVEDAAESLGGVYKGRSTGTFGQFGAFSFNGNKIITTSSGGMVVAESAKEASFLRKLATQAREDSVHYEHHHIGYNYRMSNLLAAVGRGQLSVLGERVEARRYNFSYYENFLSELPGIELMPEAEWGGHTRWLTCLTVDDKEFGMNAQDICSELARVDIEARPVWMPMHKQPVFRGLEVFGGGISESLFNTGLCLPSGSSMSQQDLDCVIESIKKIHGNR